MGIAIVPYSTRFDHDGRKYDVFIPDLSTPRCSVCGEVVLDVEAERRVTEEFLRLAVLSHTLHHLTPNDRSSMESQTAWGAALKATKNRPDVTGPGEVPTPRMLRAPPPTKRAAILVAPE